MVFQPITNALKRSAVQPSLRPSGRTLSRSSPSYGWRSLPLLHGVEFACVRFDQVGTLVVGAGLLQHSLQDGFRVRPVSSTFSPYLSSNAFTTSSMSVLDV